MKKVNGKLYLLISEIWQYYQNALLKPSTVALVCNPITKECREVVHAFNASNREGEPHESL